MISQTQIAWLTGIIDGEGCITAKMPSRSSIAFRLTIESVSESMMRSVMEILDGLDIKYWENPPISRPNSTRPSFRVYIQRKDDLRRLCNHVLPYSVVKRAELELVKTYLDKAVGHNHTATEEDLSILDQLRELKKSA